MFRNLWSGADGPSKVHNFNVANCKEFDRDLSLRAKTDDRTTLGVGVVPVALLAAIFHDAWSVLVELVFGIVLTFGTRFLGIWLTTPKREREEAEVLADY